MFWTQDGKIIIGDGGKPIDCPWCPCVDVTPTPTLSGPTPTPAANTCNSCSPPIKDTLYVECTGLPDGFAEANEKRALEWASGCGWGYTIDASNHRTLNYLEETGKWYLELLFGGGGLSACALGLFKDGPPCDPCGEYYVGNCFSSYSPCVGTECGSLDDATVVVTDS